jgi:hypothetical protein
MNESTTYVRLLLKVLNEIVTDLDFYACILPDEAGDGCDIYIFGARPGGFIAGGYALPFYRIGSDIYEDGVRVTRFFLSLRNTDEVRYYPPAVRGLWEDTWIHERLFWQVWYGHRHTGNADSIPM